MTASESLISSYGAPTAVGRHRGHRHLQLVGYLQVGPAQLHQLANLRNPGCIGVGVGDMGRPGLRSRPGCLAGG